MLIYRSGSTTIVSQRDQKTPPAEPLPQVENGVQCVPGVGAHIHSSCTVTYHKHTLDLEDEW
jgi:hypothetical protein